MQDGWLPLKNDRIESPILPDGIEFRNWNFKQDAEKRFWEVNLFSSQEGKRTMLEYASARY